MLRELNIAGMVCPNNVFLAPLAGYTNYPFREMCQRLGAGLTFTEMVSAKGLHYGSEETKLLLYSGITPPPPREGRVQQSGITPPPPREGVSQRDGGGMREEQSAHPPTPLQWRGQMEHGGITPPPPREGRVQPKAAQLFGSDPGIMREACESEALKDFDLIDINMGCPMPKIVKNGEGSALIENLPLAEKIISACVKSGKRISVKFRSGVYEGDRRAAEIAKLCEDAGACMITVHGRTRDKIYAGPVDYEQIAEAKRAVSIPVIANGGVWGAEDFHKILNETGVDGVMIARAALYNPRVFCEITGAEPPPMLPLFLRQLEETKELYGERFATVFMRKMAAFYIKGMPGSVAYKLRLFAAKDTAEVAALAEEIFQEGV